MRKTQPPTKDWTHEGSFEDCPDKPEITVDVCRHYGVRHAIDADGNIYARIYPYATTSKRPAYKIRHLPKTFATSGEFSAASLFGIDRFKPHSNVSVIVTEGEDDALAAHKMLSSNGFKTPVVSVRSSGQVIKDLSAAAEFLTGFKDIRLCFDNDKAGQEALQKAINCLPIEKVRIVKLDAKYKDAYDYLKDGAVSDFKAAVFNAKPPELDGIVSDPVSHLEMALAKPEDPVMEYNYPLLQEMTYGVRPGEMVLLTAPTSVGKSELLREFELHAIRTTDENIGLMHFEDPKGATHKRLLSKYLDKRIYLPDASYDEAEFLDAFDATFGTGRIHVLSSFGGYDFTKLLQRIRYMVVVLGCKVIFLDHITIALQTAGETVDVRMIDDSITRLRTLVHDLDFSLFLVSHVNAEGDPRGSKNIKNLSDTHIHLDRDVDGGSNYTTLSLRKNRFGGRTGNAGKLYYDEFTGRLVDATSDADPATTEKLEAYEDGCTS